MNGIRGLLKVLAIFPKTLFINEITSAKSTEK
jgi:hypothetical protein